VSVSSVSASLISQKGILPAVFGFADERNHLDLNNLSRLNDHKTTQFEVNKLMKKLTIRIVSNKQMRFEVESLMHEELNDDVMRQKSIDQIR
jgi:hypothetical protein